MLRLPPRSRVRRALLQRTGLAVWGAFARMDLDPVVLRFAPDLQYEPPREWLAAGIKDVSHGHAGYREWANEMREAFERGRRHAQ
jgi:hypothetical protein